MKIMIIKANYIMDYKDKEKLLTDVKAQMKDGIVIIDNRFEVYQVDCEKLIAK